MSKVSEWFREKTGMEIREEAPYWAGIIAIFLLATWIRYIPARSMQYLQALDPYMIARMSAGIVQNGYLPAFDVMRFFPFPTPTHTLNLGNIYIPAYLYSLVKPFGVSFLAWAKTYPAITGGLTVVPVYLLVSEVFDRKTGLLSGVFLASSVAILHRSSAGWFEKEPIALLFMMFSLYFFIRGWKRESWTSGIFSGISLGIAAISWGGTDFMMLLYPVLVGTIVAVLPLLMFFVSLILDIDIEPLENVKGLVSAYAPMAILGTTIPFILNETAAFKMQFFVLNLGVLTFLLLRYAAEKHDFVDRENLPYFSLSLIAAGIVFLIISPVIAPAVSNYMGGAINSALQSGSGVIGGTVAENQPARVNQVVQRLGASQAAAVIPGGQYVSQYFSGWTFGIIGLSILAFLVFLEFLRHYFGVKSVDYSEVLGGYLISVSLASSAMYYSFSGSAASPFIPAFVIVGVVTWGVYMFDYVQSKDAKQWYNASMVMWLLLFLATAWMGSLGAIAFLGIVGGSLIIGSREMGRKFKVTEGWLYLVFFVWMASTIYGSIQKSRLLFLAATPVAVCAGIGASRIIGIIGESDVWEWIDERREDIEVDISPKKFLVIILIGLLIAVNVSAAYVMASKGIRGSPNSAWMENLDHMREETPEGSVILSWWDYGYWFQTIGDRPAIADGGNMAYYTGGNNMSKVNLRLADFLASSNASKYRDWLEERSVDYIVLDSTMIGKYSAVSQISHGSNSEFNYMRSLQCKRQGDRCQVGQVGNNTVIPYGFSGNADLILPIENDKGATEISAAPLIRFANGQTVPVENVCTDEGIKDFHEDEGTTGGMRQAIRDSMRQGRPFGGCVAIHPHRGISNIVLVPPAIMDSTLVRLYLMDGVGIDFVEKVFDNGFAKTWEVEERG